MEERIEKLTMDWFLAEPALLKVLYSHNVAANRDMSCQMRCGKGRIEYNPELCQSLSGKEFDELMKVECIRILLKHPYDRQPQNCSDFAKTEGSNCVVGENYKFNAIKLMSANKFGLKENMYYEYYAEMIEKMLPKQKLPKDEQGRDGKGQNGDSDSSSGNDVDDNEGRGQSGLWKEDPMAVAEINEMIGQLEVMNKWGSLPGNLVEHIIATTKVKIDFRKVMQSFRADVMSSKRRLTRMRPNRRSGFENMGSVYELKSRLLVAVDVSGSITGQMICNFFGIVNKFFKYGIETIDVVQFDTEIKGEPVTMKKAEKGVINVRGRGGTCFQPVFDFAAEKKNYYQGLLIFTDGEARHPKKPPFFRIPVLWVLPNQSQYNFHSYWMKDYGKACAIEGA